MLRILMYMPDARFLHNQIPQLRQLLIRMTHVPTLLRARQLWLIVPTRWRRLKNLRKTNPRIKAYVDKIDQHRAWRLLANSAPRHIYIHWLDPAEITMTLKIMSQKQIRIDPSKTYLECLTVVRHEAITSSANSMCKHSNNKPYQVQMWDTHGS